MVTVEYVSNININLLFIFYHLTAAQTGMLKQTLAAIMNNHDPEKVAHVGVFLLLKVPLSYLIFPI